MGVGSGLATLQIEQDVRHCGIVLRLSFPSRLLAGGVFAGCDAGRLGVGRAFGGRIDRRSADVGGIAQGVGMHRNKQRCIGVASHLDAIIEIDIFIGIARHHDPVSARPLELPLELDAELKHECLFQRAADSAGAPVAPRCPGSRTMSGSGKAADGPGGGANCAVAWLSVAKAAASHGLSSILSRDANVPSMIGFEPTSAGQAGRARSMTIRDLPGASRPKRNALMTPPSPARPSVPPLDQVENSPRADR